MRGFLTAILLLMVSMCAGMDMPKSPALFTTAKFNPEAGLRRYRVYIKNVVDGDTLRGNISLGFGNVMVNQVIRLCGIEAPDPTGHDRQRGQLARTWMRMMIERRSAVLDTSCGGSKERKFGNVVGTLWVKQENGLWANVNASILEAGHAIEKQF